MRESVSFEGGIERLDNQAKLLTLLIIVHALNQS